jgi:hypothetical protein
MPQPLEIPSAISDSTRSKNRDLFGKSTINPGYSVGRFAGILPWGEFCSSLRWLSGHLP